MFKLPITQRETDLMSNKKENLKVSRPKNIARHYEKEKKNSRKQVSQKYLDLDPV